MSEILAAPMWIVITLLAFVGLVLLGPSRPYSRLLALVCAWRNGHDHRSEAQPTRLDPDRTSISPSVVPRPFKGRPSVVVILAAAVLAVGLPAVWRRRYRYDFASDMFELNAYRRVAYVARVFVRLPALRTVLLEALAEARTARR
jgi:hypothetical protein